MLRGVFVSRPGSTFCYLASFRICPLVFGEPFRRPRYDSVPASCLSLAKIPADRTQIVVESGSVLFAILADFFDNRIYHLSGTSISSGGVQITGGT